ncbi:hypothetical protein HPB51_027320 [Rhipicephalus microplus]|uniref:Uncharacterized protein n=1 Tax=Rhipicephalus microplus TaxID=6941 RepID=A0A9J6D0J2_RHIMP|nr:hypothetical protein HPB51_027320 [Rhipicephalus microplus]
MEALTAEKGITHFVLSYCDKHEMGSAQNFGALSFNAKIPNGTLFTPVYMPTYFSVYVSNIRVGESEWPGLCSEGKYNLSSDITTVYCFEDGFVVNDFPILEVLMPDAQGNIFTLKIPPSVYFQEVTLKRGDHGCYKLAVADSPSWSSLPGHSCVWELQAMGSKTWTVFIYIIIFICLMCALPVVIVGLFWLKRRMQYYLSPRCQQNSAMPNLGRSDGAVP